MPSSDREREAERAIDLIRRLERDPPPEATSIGRYEITGELGKGGMAVVYRARDPKMGRDAAVKVLGELTAGRETVRVRLQREARTMAGLTHPNVVSVYDFGEDAGRMYLVMELVEGKPLDVVLKEKERDLPSLLELLEKAARGLGAVHERGIVHRDLKPANVLITAAGEPKVGDFGLAHLMDSETRLTKTGTVLGTPIYMAPEQVEGKREDITPRTDVYALGVILYEMLTGRPPHDAETAMELYGKIVHEEPVRPGALDPAVPGELEAICLKAMDKDPARRYADAAEMAEDLKRYREGRPVEARHPTMRRLLWKRVKRHRTAWTLGAAAALIGIAAVVVAATLLTKKASRSDALDRTVQAERMYEAGRYEETRRLAKEALGIWPDLPEARYWLRRLKIREYQALRGVPDARVVRGLVEVTPPRPETERERALREEIERELKSRPIEKGILALWDGRYEEALEEFGKVPADAAAGWEAELYSATAYYLNGEFEEAKRRLARHRGREPATIVPMYVRALIALAQAKEQAGEDPTELYRQAIAEANELGGDPGRILEARALVAWGKHEASFGRDPEEKYSRAIELAEGLEAHLVRGDAWMARAAFRDGRGRLDPKDPAEY
ncbi:MAG: serine/threonine-protein kinase, partial [Planctomycetota bacterium]